MLRLRSATVDSAQHDAYRAQGTGHRAQGTGYRAQSTGL